MVIISTSVQVVNRIQKLRKTAQLEPADPVDVYYKSVGNDKNTLEEILKSQVSYNWLIKHDSCFGIHFSWKLLYSVQDQYIRDALGSPIVPKEMAPKDVVSFDPQSSILFVAPLIFKFNSNIASYSTTCNLGIFSSSPVLAFGCCLVYCIFF
jgi:hypothetical protein